jgi:hypothetical protein
MVIRICPGCCEPLRPGQVVCSPACERDLLADEEGSGQWCPDEDAAPVLERLRATGRRRHGRSLAE